MTRPCPRPTPLPPSRPASLPCPQARLWFSIHLSVFVKAAAACVRLGGRCSRCFERCREIAEETHRPHWPCQACSYEKRSVHTENAEHTRRYPPLLNPTSINSADRSLMPMTAASTSDFQRHPDLGFSTPADTDPPTTPSLFRCPARCAMTDRGSVFKVTRRCNGTIPFGLGSTFKVPRRPLATHPPCSALPRGTPSPELRVPSSESDGAHSHRPALYVPHGRLEAQSI